MKVYVRITTDEELEARAEAIEKSESTGVHITELFDQDEFPPVYQPMHFRISEVERIRYSGDEEEYPEIEVKFYNGERISIMYEEEVLSQLIEYIDGTGD